MVEALAEVRARALDPHLVLAAGAAAVLVVDGAGLERTAGGPVLLAALAATALACAWPAVERLRLAPLLGLAGGFQLVWIALHVLRGVHGDLDPRVVYTGEGTAVLHGAFPPSPYPAGAVGLFAAETWAGGGHAERANALAMVPFHALAVAAVWLLRTRRSHFLAAALALWPLDAYFWEYRFDLVPAAAIACGIVLALRGRWHAAGWVLGAGALVKWTPALTAATLAAWLASRRRPRDAMRHLLGAATPFALAYTPLVALDRHDALAPYRAQGARGITGESLPYLALRLLGLASPARRYYGVAHAPGWATPGAALVQAALVLALIALAATRRRHAAFALAALAPAVFLLTNRIFSPQFSVVIVTGIVVATALAGGAVLDVLLLLAVGTTANATLFPALAATPPDWTFVSAAALLPPALACVLVVRRR